MNQAINWDQYFKNDRIQSLKNKTNVDQKKKSAVNKKKLKQNHVIEKKEFNHKKYNIFYVILFIFLFGFLFFLTISLSYADSSLSSHEIPFQISIGSDETTVLEDYIYKKNEKNTQNNKIQNNTRINTKKIVYKKYRVKGNDTVSTIASKFGLQTDTIALVNNILSEKSLKAGDVVIIPNQNGRLVTVQKNDSIHRLAARYSVSWKDIVDINSIESDVIHPGSNLFIPGSKMTTYEKNKFYISEKVVRNEKNIKGSADNKFIWPVRGKITSYYGMREDPFNHAYLFHRGIDIKGNIGAPVVAVMSGKVIYRGWSSVYGNLLMISHDGGYMSVYAHLHRFNVKVGDIVKQGNTVGLVGNTGRSTGSHLHFEIRKNGKTVNPLIMLNK